MFATAHFVMKFEDKHGFIFPIPQFHLCQRMVKVKSQAFAGNWVKNNEKTTVTNGVAWDWISQLANFIRPSWQVTSRIPYTGWWFHRLRLTLLVFVSKKCDLYLYYINRFWGLT